MGPMSYVLNRVHGPEAAHGPSANAVFVGWVAINVDCWARLGDLKR